MQVEPGGAAVRWGGEGPGKVRRPTGFWGAAPVHSHHPLASSPPSAPGGDDAGDGDDGDEGAGVQVQRLVDDACGPLASCRPRFVDLRARLERLLAEGEGSYTSLRDDPASEEPSNESLYLEGISPNETG